MTDSRNGMQIYLQIPVLMAGRLCDDCHTAIERSSRACMEYMLENTGEKR